MAHVSVEDAKRYLNISFNDDNLLLMQIIEGSENAIALYLSRESLAELEDVSTGEIPSALKIGILSMVATLYQNREAISYGQPYRVPYTLEFLLSKFRNLDMSTYNQK